ncbi:MAG: tRNA glutamyl-Q(34) synthetase GluQRS [Arenimonas sp.]
MTLPALHRGRFAPSPTGPLHLGSLTAALASYLMVKSQRGQWLIRIEDIDPPREIAGIAEKQLRTLAGFGLLPDEPVLYQSKRSPFYLDALAKLLMEDKAFYCSCSRSQLAEQNGIHRRCVAATDPGRAAIRLRVDDRTIAFTDGVYGSQHQNLADAIGDFVLKRADGFFAYQLAVVVDDAEQGITQVVRGADLLSSTPRQIFLQQQLGLPTPAYWHIGLVQDPDGRKLSKSQWAADLDDEDRFTALCMAYRHLGQNDRVLQRSSGIASNLERALQHFEATRLPALTTPEPGGSPDAD